MSTETNAQASPVAFVLSGGGTLGAVQVGMLRALYERGIAADLLVTTSVGALNGAFIASRPATVPTATELAEVWTGLRTRDVFPLRPVTAALALLGRRNHITTLRGLRKLVEQWVEFDQLEQARVPLSTTATDVRTGEEVRLARGPAVSAILASAAIPAVFPPVRRGGLDLVDGGLTNNTPISQAVELGARTVYVLPSGYPCAITEPPAGALAMATHALTLLIHQRLVVDIERVPEQVRLVVLPPLCPVDVSPIDFSRSEELIARSVEASGQFLDGLDRPAKHLGAAAGDGHAPAGAPGHAVPELMRATPHGAGCGTGGRR